MASQEQISTIASALQASALSTDNATRKRAWEFLVSIERNPRFSLVLLQLAESPIDLSVRQCAATHLKNIVKRSWADEDEGELVISAADRAELKARLLSVISTVPPLVQRQLSEGLSLISRSDFPEKWPTLLPELVARLAGTTEVNVITGVLDTALSIFERFRDAPDTDDVRVVLAAALAGFAAPLTDIAKRMSAMVESLMAGGNGSNKSAIAPPLLALRSCAAIFFLLNALDLPEYFEDHMAEWMGIFHTFLAYRNPALAVADDDREEGPVEGLQAAILECIALYAEKYDEEFASYFVTFVTDVWALLSSMSKSRIASPNVDPLVIRGMRFLTAAVSNSTHVDVFKEDSTLRAICDSIILPNIFMRESDEESFEDNAIEFIRQDIEGSDSDTRRRVACDLVRGLCRHFNGPVTAICMAHVQELMAAYAAKPAGSDAKKEAGIALVIALSAKVHTQASGVTMINELVDIGTFLRMHLMPELSHPNINERPIVKAASIKFITAFRSQFPADQLVAVLPLLTKFLSAESFVLHTYAASSIERMLSMRDRQDRPAPLPPVMVPRLTPEHAAPLILPVFTVLFARMNSPGYPENEYLMKTILRICVVCKGRVAPFAADIIRQLTEVLARTCKNPTNPMFAHHMFECVAALMKFICESSPESVAAFEGMLMAPFQEVLARDVADFLPYVFQLLAQLLDLRPAPRTGESNLTESFKQLLPPLLTAPLWLRKGNIPALTGLVCAFARKGSVFLSQSGQLLPLLGVFQRLLGQRAHEDFAFDIICALAEGAPWEVIQPHMGVVFQLVLTRMHTGKALRTARRFVQFAGIFAGVHGPDLLETSLNAVSPGVFASIVDNVIGATGNKVSGSGPRKDTAVGLVRILTESQSVLGTPSSWAKLLATCVALCEPEPREGGGGSSAPSAASADGSSASAASAAGAPHFAGDETEEIDCYDGAVGGGGVGAVAGGTEEYSAAFSRLAFASSKDRSTFPHIPDAKRWLVEALARLGGRFPGRVPGLVDASPVAATVRMYATAAGIAIP